MSYSEPVDIDLDLSDLLPRLYSLPDQPDAVPYVTSYYKRTWGFCIQHAKKALLKPGNYHVKIDSTLAKGYLNYGEVLIVGSSAEEVLISTYICHPSMANNELSGPVVSTALINWIESLENLKYSYRFIFIPETIGSLVFLSRSLEHLQKFVFAGFNVSCVGDDRSYSYLPSRDEQTLSDSVAKHVLKHTSSNYVSYKWTDRGSDERQYCAPGIDLPIASIMRTKYGAYPEYHTSLDDLTVVTPSGLYGGFTALRRAIYVIEHDYYPLSTVLGEPQLGKRNLYPSSITKLTDDNSSQINIARTYLNILTYSDGNHSLLDIANLLDMPFWHLLPLATVLLDNGLIEKK